MSSEPRERWPIVKGRLGDREPNPYAHLTPEECMGLVWELTRTAWAAMGHTNIDPTLRRDVVRVVRRGS